MQSPLPHPPQRMDLGKENTGAFRILPLGPHTFHPCQPRPGWTHQQATASALVSTQVLHHHHQHGFVWGLLRSACQGTIARHAVGNVPTVRAPKPAKARKAALSSSDIFEKASGSNPGGFSKKLLLGGTLLLDKPAYRTSLGEGEFATTAGDNNQHRVGEKSTCNTLSQSVRLTHCSCSSIANRSVGTHPSTTHAVMHAMWERVVPPLWYAIPYHPSHLPPVVHPSVPQPRKPQGGIYIASGGADRSGEAHAGDHHPGA